MGSPVKKTRKLTEEEIASIPKSAAGYVKYQRTYRQVDTYDKNPFYDVE